MLADWRLLLEGFNGGSEHLNLLLLLAYYRVHLTNLTTITMARVSLVTQII